MAPRSPQPALLDMLRVIASIRRLTAGTTLGEIDRDEVRRAALERFFEVLSEASRRLPAEMKQRHEEVPWRAVASLGDRLRHEYHRVSLEILWEIATNELDQLEAVLNSMLLAAVGGDPPS